MRALKSGVLGGEEGPVGRVRPALEVKGHLEECWTHRAGKVEGHWGDGQPC